MLHPFAGSREKMGSNASHPLWEARAKAQASAAKVRVRLELDCMVSIYKKTQISVYPLEEDGRLLWLRKFLVVLAQP